MSWWQLRAGGPQAGLSRIRVCPWLHRRTRSRQKAFAMVGNSAGQGMAEYIIIVILVAVIIILGIRYFGSGVSQQFQNATQQIESPDDVPGIEPTGGKNRDRGGSGVDMSVASGGDGSEIETGESSAGGVPAADSDSEMAALRHKGIGADKVKPTEEISLNWRLVAFLAGACVLAGLAVVFAQHQKKKRKDKKQEKKRKKKKLFSRSDESGQAIVEFVLSAITLFFVILGVLQLALVLNAQSLVQYAAYNAARAAIVHGGDSSVLQDKMNEAARVSLLAVFPRHGRADHLRGLMENYRGAKETDQQASLTYFNEPITEVQMLPTALGSSGDVITFDDELEASRANVTVQVVHRYELVIPLVNRILFYLYTRYRSGAGYSGESADYLARITDKKRRSGDFHDIEYRLPLVAHYTMRLQSDLIVP